MHLIDDIYFIFTFCRAVSTSSRISRILSTPLLDAASISITFIEFLPDRLAHRHILTWASVYRMLTVDCLCKYLCNRCLTGSSRSAEQICMSDTVRIDLIFQALSQYDPVLLHPRNYPGRNFRYRAVYDSYKPLLSNCQQPPIEVFLLCTAAAEKMRSRGGLFTFLILISLLNQSEADTDLFGCFDLILSVIPS